MYSYEDRIRAVRLQPSEMSVKILKIRHFIGWCLDEHKWLRSVLDYIARRSSPRVS